MRWENCGRGKFVEVGIRNLVWDRHWKGLFVKPEELLVTLAMDLEKRMLTKLVSHQVTQSHDNTGNLTQKTNLGAFFIKTLVLCTYGQPADLQSGFGCPHTCG